MPALGFPLGGDEVEFDPSDNKIVRLLKAVTHPIQSLWDTFQTVRTELWIENAVGAQLDLLGVIVGQRRDGLEDDVYRRYIRARIITNNSTGLIADAVKVARLVVIEPDANLVLENQGRGAYVLRVEDIAITFELRDVLAYFLGLATVGGVRAIVESSAEDPSTWLRLDVGTLDQHRLIGATTPSVHGKV